MKITYYNHATVKIENEKYSIIVDPFFKGNGYDKPLDTIGKIDFILVTHGHFDHIGDTIELAKLNNALVISNPEIVSYVGSFGVNTMPIQPGSFISTEFGRLKATIASHTSSIDTENGKIYGGIALGYIIEMDNKKVYHAGDTGLLYDMILLKEENIDLAILPIGGHFTMGINEAKKAIEFIEPKIIMPIHFNTFPVIQENPYKLKEMTDKEVKVLSFNESFEL